MASLATLSSTPLDIPLVLDLDGTLLKTDTLHEATVATIKEKPLKLFALPLWALRGKAHLKEKVVPGVLPHLDTLPYREEILEFAKAEDARGRKVYLVTGAHHVLAESLYGLHQWLAEAWGTEERNLTGKNKADFLASHFGAKKFLYIGDSKVDTHIYKLSLDHHHVAKEGTLKPLLKGLRPHQWMKNALLAVPLILSFSFTWEAVGSVALAFLLFSLLASATYLFNDLMDLPNDRVHPKKKERPLASGRLPIARGVTWGLLLGAGSFLVSALVLPLAFTLTMGVYLLATLAYTFVLKRVPLADVFMLGVLFTLRVVAGALLLDVPLTMWLLSFSFMVFLSLAILKRVSELQRMADEGATEAKGRGYQVADLKVMLPMGLAAAFTSVGIFFLYVDYVTSTDKYASPALLWLSGPLLLLLQAHLWLKESRGLVQEDPLVFLLKDRTSRWILFFIAVIFILAKAVSFL